MRYYPSFAVKINLVANGDLKLDGKPYSGYYYETFDGEVFSGPNPVIGPGEKLSRSQIAEGPDHGTTLSYFNPFTYSTTGKDFTLDGKPYSGPYFIDSAGDYRTPPDAQPPQNANRRLESTGEGVKVNKSAALGIRSTNQNLFEPTPYYPFPLESDYSVGYITRYFVKRVNDRGYVVEISPDEYAAIQNGSVRYDVSFYTSAKILWRIRGAEKSVRLSQYDFRESVEDTNKRLVEKLDTTFLGIKAFIGGDYKKFYRPDIVVNFPTGSSASTKFIYT
jgi:hypothetical protein